MQMCDLQHFMYTTLYHCCALQMCYDKTNADSDIFICDFHRKQAWQRWTKATKNGVADCQEHILQLLNVSNWHVYMLSKQCIR